MAQVKVPFDPELDAILKSWPKDTRPVTKEDLPRRRRILRAGSNPAIIFLNSSILHETKKATGPNGEIELEVLRKKDGAKGTRPAIYFIHGGAMVFGSRFYHVNSLFEWIKELDIVLISVEYRLAPEHPHPAPIEDCYAGFQWVGEHASELGIDSEKIMLCGQSAGGGLAAGLTHLIRDRGEPNLPKILAQCLIYPMLDDRGITPSSKQYMAEGTYTGELNVKCWNWLLDGKSGTDDVSIYAAPARATDLSGLPPAWIDVGSAEPFRDEDVAYALKLWEAGIQAELHVWPGAWHAFDMYAPHAKLSKVCNDTRLAWARKIFAAAEGPGGVAAVL